VISACPRCAAGITFTSLAEDIEDFCIIQLVVLVSMSDQQSLTRKKVDTSAWRELQQGVSRLTGIVVTVALNDMDHLVASHVRA
jgi:hypothetical protein